ncbi:serine palmitoyltransferase small subunit B [Drosophila sulfurigaster albostrigata]|uniref:Serine palmitoyltransferase small subunit B n=1 Tax=Drosophila albomicans TaxID=7291 RepID=A0A6P8XTC9_DROAB|nr:serine palmitoyltransferase small subunit B [Drosophila albomicans]XP_060649619.1 serine palmitoyltransferase small subunit B [Drosophila nasuta]XP_062123144.1 serine palmitoyltransferase small subunit B [Drosophila sulfurigaster albostrigata]
MWNLKQTASHLYRQYELITCINMFEPWEKKLINGFFLIMVVLVIFSSYVYLPSYMETLLEVIKPTTGSSQPSEKAYVPMKISSF